MFHYTYLIREKFTGEFYFGVRTSKVLPGLDSYMGSMKRWKPKKENLEKVIINQCSTREEANAQEKMLIDATIDHPLNRNYHNTKNWCTYGSKVSDETREKLSITLKETYSRQEVKSKLSASLRKAMNRPETKQKISAIHKGKILSKETKNKISNVVKGRKWYHNTITGQTISVHEAPIGPGWILGMKKRKITNG